jgi:hypothetical protein
MDGSTFLFLRATFFRWAGQIEDHCGDLAGAPVTHCVGDLHTENYGTWRDDDGRLVWGVNDFDDADAMPYAFDLVRLATSVFLAPHLEIGEKHVADAILEGYRDGLDNPAPTLVYQHARWILDLVKDGGKHFYSELDDCPDAQPPPAVTRALTESLPAGAILSRLVLRLGRGGGGLGRPRYAAIAQWRGGVVAREAKAWVPSSWGYAQGHETTPAVYLDVAKAPHRSWDPKLGIEDRFVIRRLAPDSQKIELGDEAGKLVTSDVLRGMGREAAAIHARDDPTVRAIRDHLAARPPGWLADNADVMREAVKADHHAWRKRG